MTNQFTVVEQLKIKQAEIKDAERIAILCDEQLGFTVTNQQIEQRLAKIQNNSSHVVYVATLANEYVIGWAHAHISDLIVRQASAIIWGLVVDKDYRHSRIGRCLMQQIEQWAFLAGCDSVLLTSNIKRKDAHLFYEKIGYRNIKQSLTFQKKLLECDRSLL
ncbi:GNAT family N-acetyltransferase [Nostoc sp. UCD121]|uniref:GNAT family N-acetyltransferase n=1 Tax=unclassified Nostoc TaxID=2593658 RepID=UPI00162345C9|nr:MULTISPECIES: GNAT family N-acetyltransferase [unclassified Nostoc]MBC1220631.1 GNAT family N-acetyltransferase [Nostoc sp. UCD120]MBC1275482.1 GNAT family N-acetyltransferase [Nostoc sp. UCD121]MBC1294809.1 GNAT family N-acetyltransferase [Nostoc sp. UCD122]